MLWKSYSVQGTWSMRGGCFEGSAASLWLCPGQPLRSQRHGPWLLQVLLADVSIEAMRRSQSVGSSERIVLTCGTVLTDVAIRILSNRLSTDWMCFG